MTKEIRAYRQKERMQYKSKPKALCCRAVHPKEGGNMFLPFCPPARFPRRGKEHAIWKYERCCLKRGNTLLPRVTRVTL